MPRLKRKRNGERRRERRKAEVERAWALHNTHVDTLRLGWLAAHFERQKRRCAYCGIAMAMSPPDWKDPERATLDHRVARSKGGADTLENTVAACQRCNSWKGAMDPERFRKLRRGSTV